MWQVRSVGDAAVKLWAETNGCLLWGEVFGFCVCCEVKCPSVKMSTCITVKSGTGFFLWHFEFVNIYFITLQSGKTFLAWIVLQKYINTTITNKNSNSFSEEGREPLTERLVHSSIFTSHWPLLPTDKCNSIVHIMKGKEVQVCISLRHFAWCFPLQEVTSLLLSDLVHLLSAYKQGQEYVRMRGTVFLD